MMEKIQVQDGRLTWADQVVDGLSFEVEIANDASILIEFDLLEFDVEASQDEGIRIFHVLQDIHLQRSRRVKKFSLSGSASDGTKISTNHARLSVDSEFTLGSTISLKSVATADELFCVSPVSSEAPDEFDACVEYLTRGQLGGVGHDSVELPVGKLSYTASCKVDEARTNYGSLCIEKRLSRQQLDDWIKDCDEVAERALHLLSIAQGRWFQWSARIVYWQTDEGSRKLHRCIRPRNGRQAVRVHLFHHLNLGPLFNLLKSTYTRELVEETGLGTALLLMLTSSPWTEGRMWNQLVALEHLLGRFSPKVTTTIDKSTFKGIEGSTGIKGALLETLQSALENAGYSSQSDEFKILKERISGMNGPTLYSKFLQFVGHYSIPIDDLDKADVKFVVTKCRNDLAHSGVPTTIGDDLDRLYEMVDLAEEILNRIVMALINYEGTFVSAFDRLEHYRFSKSGVALVNPQSEGSQ